jgi:hypothetical protein
VVDFETKYVPWTELSDDYCEYWLDRGGGSYDEGLSARGCNKESESGQLPDSKYVFD